MLTFARVTKEFQLINKDTKYVYILQTSRQAGRQAGKQASRQAGRQAGRQTDRWRKEQEDGTQFWE